MRVLMVLGLLMSGVSLAWGQQLLCPCGPPVLASEFAPSCKPQSRFWDDGTILTVVSGLQRPSQIATVSTVVAGIPMSFVVQTEERVRYTLSSGGECVGLKVRGFEDPKGIIDLGLGVFGDVNKPAYLCTPDAVHGDYTVCFMVDARGAQGPASPDPACPSVGVREVCAAATLE